ncbi:MAG: hypothetical protein ACTHN8_15170 [Angustibacter sp.]
MSQPLPDAVPAPLRAAAGRPAAGLFLLLAMAGGLLLAVGDVSDGRVSSVVAVVGALTVGVSLVAAAVLAWRDSRRRQRSLARSLLDSVRSVLCWLAMLF